MSTDHTQEALAEISSLMHGVLSDLNSIAINCQGCSVCEGDPGGGHEMNYHIAAGAAEALGDAIALLERRA